MGQAPSHETRDKPRSQRGVSICRDFVDKADARSALCWFSAGGIGAAGTTR
jgi:hypothetical protein